jgi:hypothetical protein
MSAAKTLPPGNEFTFNVAFRQQKSAPQGALDHFSNS